MAPRRRAATFDAFISYSHEDGVEVAKALQQELSRLGKQWYRRRALRTFLDDSSLSASPSLWSGISSNLEQSDWFVLLASPHAAASTWVARELEHWLSGVRSADYLLLAVIDGAILWDAETGRFDPALSTAVPPLLVDAFESEPRHVDLTWAREDDGSMAVKSSDPRFLSAAAEIAAPIHGIPKDELQGEDLRQHRRATNYRRLAISLLAALAVGLAVLALTASSLADERATALADLEDANGTLGELEHEISGARTELADIQERADALGRASASLQADDPWSAMALALEAESSVTGPMPEAREAWAAATHRLGDVGFRVSGAGIVDLPDDLEAAAMAPDASHVATLTQLGDLAIFDAEAGVVEQAVGVHEGARDLVWSPMGDRLAVFGGDSVTVVALDGPSTRTRHPPYTEEVAQVNGLAWAPDGARLVTTDPSGARRWRVTVDGSLVDPTEPVLPSVGLGASEGLAHVGEPTWLADGSIGFRVNLTYHVLDREDRLVQSAPDLESSGTINTVDSTGRWLASVVLLADSKFTLVDLADPEGGRDFDTRLPPAAFAWNPAGTMVAVVYDDGVDVVQVDNDGLDLVTRERIPTFGVRPTDVRWLSGHELVVLDEQGMHRRWTRTPPLRAPLPGSSGLVYASTDNDVVVIQRQEFTLDGDPVHELLVVRQGAPETAPIPIEFNDPSFEVGVVGPFVDDTLMVAGTTAGGPVVVAVELDREGRQDSVSFMEAPGTVVSLGPQGGLAVVNVDEDASSEASHFLWRLSDGASWRLDTGDHRAVVSWLPVIDQLVVTHSDGMTSYHLDEVGPPTVNWRRSHDDSVRSLATKAAPRESTMVQLIEDGQQRLVLRAVDGQTGHILWSHVVVTRSPDLFGLGELAWLPDEQSLLVDLGKQAKIFDVATQQFVGEPVRSASSNGGAIAADLDIAATKGHLVVLSDFSSDESGELQWLELVDAEAGCTMSAQTGANSPTGSPDAPVAASCDALPPLPQRPVAPAWTAPPG